MRFESVSVPGAYLVHDNVSPDARGSFSRIFCAEEFGDAGIPGRYVQMGLSRTLGRGTLRGMHFQHAPKAEGKLIRCMRGRVFDAIVDLRKESQTFKQSFTVELSGDDNRALYVPPGLAHGFLTLTDHVEMLYSMTDIYAAELADGVRWDDPAFGIAWPEPVRLISERDRNFKDFL